MSDHSTTPNTKDANHCTDPAEFLRMLIEHDDIFELRSPKCPNRPGGTFVSTAAGWFNDVKRASIGVEHLESLRPPAVYVTLNTVEPALLARAANRIGNQVKSTTSDADIVRRRWLFIDIDSKRPACVSSTDDELFEASKLSETLRAAMSAKGWPEPLQGMSGNGRYLLWRIDLPNDDDSKELVQGVLNAMASLFNTKGAEVDCSTFNAARICKVLGTVARKGDELIGVEGIEDRPHRQSWFIMPHSPLGIVSVEQLAALVSSAKPEPVAVPSVGSGKPSVLFDTVERARRYLAKMDPAIEGEKGSTKLIKAAAALVRGFDLSQGDALSLLQSDYNGRCKPEWSDKELKHKVEDADKVAGERGYLLRDRLDGVDLSEFAIPGERGLPAGDRVDEPWPELVSIDRPSVPVFPVDELPEPLRSWVSATAEACQVPADLPGLLALAVCGGACARRVVVRAGRGWFEPINLYVACLLEPANRKSAVFSIAMKPLRLIEAELMQKAAPEVARAGADRRIKESELKNLEKKAASGCGESKRSAGDLAAQLAAEPVAVSPKLLVDDATAEAVEIQLAAQGGRLVVAGCEGGLFDVMAGRYSSGVANLDCFLKGHAGDDLRVDRVTRGSIVVDRCCLTLAYAIQPEVIRGMADRPSFRGRGLIGRFMYSVPVSKLGSRRINPEPVPVAIAARYEELIRRLAAIPMDDEPWVIRLSNDSAERFYTWQVEVETWLGDSGRLRDLRDWGGKLCGLTARLAAILHLVETDSVEPWNVPISLSVIESAIEIARWSVFHAEAVIGLMTGAGGGLDDAAYVLRWIRESERTEFTRRDAQNHGRSRFDGEPEKLDDALELLVERGWIRPIATTERPGPGRKPSPRYAVNPAIAGGRIAPVTPTADVVIEPPARVRGFV